MELRKKNKGFLTVLSIILIVLFALLGRYLLELETTTSHSIYETHLNRKALYIASAVLKLGEQYVKKEGEKYQNRTFEGNYPFNASENFQGSYTLTIEKQRATALLASSISETTTSLTLSSADGFAPYGTLLIDQEIIWYQKTNQQNLLNLKRGMLGTTAAGHTSGSIVNQNFHLVTANVYLPNKNNYQCKKVVNSIITWNGSSYANSNITDACLVSGGKITIGSVEQHFSSPGNLIVNNLEKNIDVTPSQPTITAGSSIEIKFPGGGLQTHIGTLNHPQLSSDLTYNHTHRKGNDVTLNNADVAVSSKLWSSFFDFAQSSSAARQQGYTIGTTANQLQDKNWFQGSTSLIFNDRSIGSKDRPVTIIVDGDLEIFGDNTKIFGAIYVTGNLVFHGAGNYKINGMIITEGSTTIGNSLIINRDNEVMQNLGWQSSSDNNVTGRTITFENLSSD